MPKKIGPHRTGPQLTIEQEHNNRNLKWRRILELLIQGRRLTRFDVEAYGDHCFNTSVSVISKKGIQISREAIVIAGKFGTFRCKLYWLEPDQIAAALMLLRRLP